MKPGRLKSPAGREPAVISKATLKPLQRRTLDRELHPCLTPRTPPTGNWLTDNEAYVTGELIALHDANMALLVACRGMSDPGRAGPLSGEFRRVAEISDLFRGVSATYGGYSEGHIFNDANKRTALNSALLFRAQGSGI
uniref:hypothetical protein n=1 Tax=Salmonella sp. TaxID=599 RepID=UPI001CDA0F62|nr:hypothetical protein [Salmonella sp.]